MPKAWSWATCIHRLPTCFTRSSLYLVWGRPIFHLLVRDCHSRTFLPHWFRSCPLQIIMYVQVIYTPFYYISGSSMHRFPNAFKFPECFKAWVTLVGGKLESASDYEFYQKKLICDIHFTPEDRVRNNRLKAYAIPSLYLHGMYRYMFYIIYWSNYWLLWLNLRPSLLHCPGQ